MKDSAQARFESKHVESLLRQAESYMRDGRLEQASDTIKRVLAMAPANMKARRVMSLINARAGFDATRGH